MVSSIRSHNSGLRVVALAIVILVAVSSLFSVNTFPVIGNDSLFYIEHSRNLGEMGWVELGYRQVGYPIYLSAVRQVSRLLGAEPLFAVALVQRILLVGAGVLAFVLWRWLSLPLIIFLLAPQTIGLTNFVLIEGLALPLALLVAISATFFVRTSRLEGMDRSGSPVVSGICVGVGVLLLVAMRFSFIAFTLVPGVLVAAAWQTRWRRLAVAIVAVVWIATVGLIAALSIENESEYGVRSPAVNGEPAAYYYAWAHSFSRHPDNRTDPTMSRFYDDGEIRDFLREMDGSGLSYRQSRSIYQREISSMMKAAGTSLWRARIESTLWTLAAGRIDDLGSAVRAVVESTRSGLNRAMVPNGFADQYGLEAFAEQYNDSQVPNAWITDQVAKPPPIPNSRAVLRLLGPIAVVVMGMALVRRQTRPLAATGLLVVLISAAGLGFLLADNYRLLVTSLVFGIGIATESAVGLIDHGERRMA